MGTTLIYNRLLLVQTKSNQIKTKYVEFAIKIYIYNVTNQYG